MPVSVILLARTTRTWKKHRSFNKSVNFLFFFQIFQRRFCKGDDNPIPHASPYTCQEWTGSLRHGFDQQPRLAWEGTRRTRGGRWLASSHPELNDDNFLHIPSLDHENTRNSSPFLTDRCEWGSEFLCLSTSLKYVTVKAMLPNATKTDT